MSIRNENETGIRWSRFCGSQMADESSRYDVPRKPISPNLNVPVIVGKTTSTVNTAAALANKGAQVLVIDMDPQGNASTALGVSHASGEPSVYDVIEGRSDLGDVITVCPDFPTFDVVPASIDLSGAELEVADLPNRNTLLKEALTSTCVNQINTMITCSLIARPAWASWSSTPCVQ